MKNKKNIALLLLIAVVSLVGLTVAYFSSSTILNNQFQTTEYGADIIEKFESPAGWKPGDETPKELSVTNTGNVYEAVRVKVEEKWLSNNNSTLPLKQGNNVAAIINWTNTNDWTKVDVANEDYYYYYYNYKLAPNETTSKLLDKVTFNPLIDASTTCTETIENGVLTKSCKSNGTGYDKATYTITFTIETVQYNKYNEAWNLNDTVTILPEKPVPASQYLLDNATNAANAEYNADTKKKMFTFTHGEGANAQTETRYIGDEPNNYVYFNCDDMDNQSASTCEVWRILGVFDVDDGNGNIEQRMKLVRGSDLATTMYWNNGSNINDWTDTNASLKVFLNGDYYNGTATNGLKASARNIIGNAKYYLGAFEWNNSDTTYTTEYIYSLERGTTPCYNCNNDVTKTTWTGVVGLMYPSDMYMTYAKTEGVGCYNQPMSNSVCGVTNGAKSWIYNTNKLEGNSAYQWTWFLSPCSTYTIAFDAVSDYLGNNYVGLNSGGVRPVVYLKSDIKITEGTGEAGSPFKLGIIQ